MNVGSASLDPNPRHLTPPEKNWIGILRSAIAARAVVVTDKQPGSYRTTDKVFHQKLTSAV